MLELKDSKVGFSTTQGPPFAVLLVSGGVQPGFKARGDDACVPCMEEDTCMS